VGKAHQEPPTLGPAGSSGACDLRVKTVLVVDDSPAMLRYLRMLLEVDSDRLEAVTNGLC